MLYTVKEKWSQTYGKMPKVMCKGRRLADYKQFATVWCFNGVWSTQQRAWLLTAARVQ